MLAVQFEIISGSYTEGASMRNFLGILAIFAITLGTLESEAKSRGGHSIGGGIIIMSPSQDGLDDHIDAVNTSQGVAVGKFGSAYEIFGHYSYRFSGSIFALQFKPSYFTSSTSGNGYSYSLTGFTLFPILKLFPLENNFIKFFLQAGLGFGSLNGKISQPAGSVNYKGSAFGALGGLGAEFCFTANHCMVVEGNLRYLPIERNIISSVSGSPVEVDSPTNGGELERGNRDLGTTMSGIQGGVSYTFSF